MNPLALGRFLIENDGSLRWPITVPALFCHALFAEIAVQQALEGLAVAGLVKANAN